MPKTPPDSEPSLGQKSTATGGSGAEAATQAAETKKATKPRKSAQSGDAVKAGKSVKLDGTSATEKPAATEKKTVTEEPAEPEEPANPGPPRTVKRRASRRLVPPKRAAAQPAPPAPDSESADLAPAADSAAAAKPIETVVATEENKQAGSPQASDPAPRTGRIEVPVPSVQRARERGALAEKNPIVLRTESLTKSYGEVLAATEVSIAVHSGSFTGVVGPNGAGKTTVLSMISGLNRPTSGRITVHDIDVWVEGPKAKRLIGTLPDRLRLFDRLTGAQLLYYAGVLQGVEDSSVAMRARELAQAFGLESALDRLVSDYSAGMQKKIGLACSMIHAPDVLVLDEPFEAIDPVSASNVTDILEKFVAGGGSVVMSSHSLDLIQRVCDHVAVIVDGSVIAQGTVDSVRDGLSLEERFKHLTRVEDAGKGLEWLHGFSGSE